MSVATSARNLAVGSGNVTTVAGSPILVFVNSQAFKEGATVVVDYAGTPQYFTIDSGSDKAWVAMQNATSGVTKPFKTSDTGSGRNRGTDGVIVPNAVHYMYRGVLDGGAAADWYYYFDTLFPEKGLHPFTKDQYSGSAVSSSKTAQALVPDAGTRLRIVEGMLRGAAGTTLTPDARISDLVARVTALETWANSGGHFGTPPSVGSGATVTIQNALDYGDA